MKKVWTYFAIGCVVAIVGMYFADIFSSIFNRIDYGAACALGMGMYLCVVVITCTGIVISRISAKPNEDASDDIAI